MTTYEQVLAGKVALGYADTSLNDFGRRIAHYIDAELAKPLPDNALIKLLADAANIGWELYGTGTIKRTRTEG